MAEGIIHVALPRMFVQMYPVLRKAQLQVATAGVAMIPMATVGQTKVTNSSTSQLNGVI